MAFYSKIAEKMRRDLKEQFSPEQVEEGPSLKIHFSGQSVCQRCSDGQNSGGYPAFHLCGCKGREPWRLDTCYNVEINRTMSPRKFAYALACSLLSCYAIGVNRRGCGWLQWIGNDGYEISKSSFYLSFRHLCIF